MTRRLLPLLRLAARYPLGALAVSASLLAAPLGLAVWAARPASTQAKAPAEAGKAADGVAPSDDPSLLEGRIWLDRFPEEPKDKFSLWIFLDNGIGAYRNGTGYRFQVEIVGYKRDGDTLAVTVLEDGARKSTRYSIKSCDDKPPFDLCLTFQNPPLGPAKLYGFKDEDQNERAIEMARSHGALVHWAKPAEAGSTRLGAMTARSTRFFAMTVRSARFGARTARSAGPRRRPVRHEERETR